MPTQVNTLPPGLRAEPLYNEEQPLRICVVARSSPDPVQGSFVLLRVTPDARVFLGCVTDRSGAVREWIEIWTQSTEGLDASFSGAREPDFAKRADARWKAENESLTLLQRDQCLVTGWENEKRPPVTFNADGKPSTFNPEGGFLRILSYSRFSLAAYVDALGTNWAASENGASEIENELLDAIVPTNREVLHQSGALLFANFKEPRARLPEIFFLKVQALREVLQIVRGFVERHQLPFLNLAADSFRVQLGNIGAGLPIWWTTQINLVKTSNAQAINIAGTEARYFVRRRAFSESIYLPEGISRFVHGSGAVRIRKVTPERQGTVVEGTLLPAEPRKFSPHDLLWLKLPLAERTVDLYGHLFTAESLASGEARFVTFPQSFSKETNELLTRALNSAFPSAPFEVVPVLSSPCDLYSLGVLAIRCLLVNERNSLPIALDELLSLARGVALQPSSTPLPRRVMEALRADNRFLNGLGPHRLVREAWEPNEAFNYFPEEIWCDLLALLIRLFPGAAPESFSKDLGDAPALALETVFDGAIAELDRILLRARTLVFIDWHSNREMHSIIAEIKEALAKQ